MDAAAKAEQSQLITDSATLDGMISDQARVRAAARRTAEEEKKRVIRNEARRKKAAEKRAAEREVKLEEARKRMWEEEGEDELEDDDEEEEEDEDEEEAEKPWSMRDLGYLVSDSESSEEELTPEQREYEERMDDLVDTLVRLRRYRRDANDPNPTVEELVLSQVKEMMERGKEGKAEVSNSRFCSCSRMVADYFSGNLDPTDALASEAIKGFSVSLRPALPSTSSRTTCGSSNLSDFSCVTNSVSCCS